MSKTTEKTTGKVENITTGTTTGTTTGKTTAETQYAALCAEFGSNAYTITNLQSRQQWLRNQMDSYWDAINAAKTATTGTAVEANGPTTTAATA